MVVVMKMEILEYEYEDRWVKSNEELGQMEILEYGCSHENGNS